MAEYIKVEKPFLDKLRQLGWQVIDQGIGVPQEPQRSLRENFKQVLLPQELDKIMPDYREQENWLKQNGVKMSI